MIYVLNFNTVPLGRNAIFTQQEQGIDSNSEITITLGQNIRLYANKAEQLDCLHKAQILKKKI